MKKIVSVRTDGQLDIAVDNKLFQTVRSVHTWYTNPTFGLVFLALLALMDIFGFLQIARATLPTDSTTRLMVVSGFTASFEFAPMYMGYVISLKAYGLGRPIQKSMFWLAFAASVIGAALNGTYRIMTMDIAYTIASQTGQEITTDPIALPMTVLLTVMPIITSLVNMVVGCLSYDPLLFDIIRIKRKIAVLTEKKRQIDAAISELTDESVKNTRLSDAKVQHDFAVYELSSVQTQLKKFIRVRNN